MFLVFNKSKIYSYLIAVCTVFVLFVAAANLNDAVSPNKNVVETSTNIVNLNNVSQNSIVNE